MTLFSLFTFIPGGLCGEKFRSKSLAGSWETRDPDKQAVRRKRRLGLPLQFRPHQDIFGDCIAKGALTMSANVMWTRSLVSESRPSKSVKAMAPQSQVPESRFEPCASTASLFLYAQGSVILCLHHDTLAVERRFTSHQDNIDFISVDNVSERGAGRLVVSYDVGQTAIVWDIFTGTEIARFASFEHLRVASWMRNGNVAFGMNKRAGRTWSFKWIADRATIRQRQGRSNSF